ncbi:MAG: retroviral-like aspartic protease family protein [Chloroflexi bacterium]|nr:retroviral-like aspartic protease family protein [Chloroflexota bacterium]
MGYIRVKGKVSARLVPDRWQEVEFIVDTGAMWSVIPAPVLDGLGIRPKGQRKLRLANGQAETFDLGDAYIEVQGIEVGTTVIFGKKGAPALLGVTTLEQMGLEVDPVSGKLKPMELYLL